MSEHERQVIFLYADGRTLDDSCDRAIMPAYLLEQMSIHPLDTSVLITYFKRISDDTEEPMLYEEYLSEHRQFTNASNQEAIEVINRLRKV